MHLFAIGDLHLSSQGKRMDIFGPQWKNHQERLFDNWRRIVKPEDIVLIAGDVSWALKLEEAMTELREIGELPGIKILIRGNHDYWWSSRGKVASVLPRGMVAINASAWTHHDLSIVGTRGWNVPGAFGFDEKDHKIYLRELNRLKIGLEQVPRRGTQKIVAMLHYPPLTRTIRSSGFTELLESFGVSVCVYAHLHGEDYKIAFEGTHNGVTFLFVACDHLGFQPLRVAL